MKLPFTYRWSEFTAVMMISAAMRDFPRGGVKSFRKPTTALAVAVAEFQIHLEEEKPRAEVTSGVGLVSSIEREQIRWHSRRSRRTCGRGTERKPSEEQITQDVED
jgi:hypothetical protein